MPLPGVRRGSSAALAALISIACEATIEPTQCPVPAVVRSSVAANPRNVLSAIVTVEARGADSVAVQFGRAANSLDVTTAATAATETEAIVPVLGLQAATRYHFQAVAFNECGTGRSETHQTETGALPLDLPAYVGSGTDPSPGYVAFAAGAYGIVIDNTGRVVWYHRFANGPGLNFQPQPNGRYAARPNAGPSGPTPAWIEINALGEVTRTLSCARGLQARMHDMLAQVDGSYWLLCDEIRTKDLSIYGGSSAASVLGTGVQHISATGEILFDWSPFDHLEVDPGAIKPEDRTGSVINWTHGNALDLDTDGNVIISYRNPSEIVKVDTRTGAVMWRMGGTRNQFTFENDAQPAFARQHGVRSIGTGRLQLLDNLGDPQRSRAKRYEYDAARRTIRLGGSFVSSTNAIAQVGGTTQGLPGNRILVAFGDGGSVEEYDLQGRVVWRLEGNPGYVFRAHRIRSLYRPGFGDPR